LTLYLALGRCTWTADDRGRDPIAPVPLVPSKPPTETLSKDRLDSWKEIAAYLKRDVTTVQRWEKREGMPVHRHLHDKVGSVYASQTELDAWVRSRNLPAVRIDGSCQVEIHCAAGSAGPVGDCRSLQAFCQNNGMEAEWIAVDGLGSWRCCSRGELWRRALRMRRPS